jgi:phospholipase C
MNPPKFDHLVVVMMENRSFDHMLGMLYTKDNPPPNGQAFDGLDWQSASNPDPSNGNSVAAAPAQCWEGVMGDPFHDFTSVQWQLFWTLGETITSALPLIPPSQIAPMQGFAADYGYEYPAPNPPPPYQYPLAEVMSYFPTYAGGNNPGLRVLPTLAQAFAVCDRWFASAPTQTFPNRSFCNAGTSNGFVSNDEDWIHQNTNRTIFTALSGELGPNNPWCVYHDMSDQEVGDSLTFLIHWPELKLFDKQPGYRQSIDKFAEDAASGNLPAYAFIEPRITTCDTTQPYNDQHPQQNICFGENFINSIYSALVNSPAWERTLLVITYDEHGGLFDHVSPPTGVPDPSPSPTAFNFTRLGVRVPAVIVSPYIPPGTVYRPSNGWADHTAIIKTLTRRWGLPHLTVRDAAAPDLSELLTLDKPRTDLPLILNWDVLPPPSPELIPANDLQRDFIRLVARAHGLPPPTPPRTHADVVAFLRSVPRQKAAS